MPGLRVFSSAIWAIVAPWAVAFPNYVYHTALDTGSTLPGKSLFNELALVQQHQILPLNVLIFLVYALHVRQKIAFSATKFDVTAQAPAH